MADWLDTSIRLFHDIKSGLGVPDAWTFSLAGPDVAPVDSKPEELRDLVGTAAFMLRRIQAMRFLLANDEPIEPRLFLGYASDLYVYLVALAETESKLSRRHLDTIRAGAMSTRTLIGEFVVAADF